MEGGVTKASRVSDLVLNAKEPCFRFKLHFKSSFNIYSSLSYVH